MIFAMSKLGVWFIWLIKGGDSLSEDGWMKVPKISFGS
jgi:hypothetical protein